MPKTPAHHPTVPISTVLVLGLLASGVDRPTAAGERIYVGQLNPAQVQMFSYEPLSGTFVREDFDPGDADPATPLTSNVEFFGMTANADTFLFAQPASATAFGAIDVATRLQLPRPTTVDSASAILLDPSGSYAYLIGGVDNQNQTLQVIDLRPSQSTYLEPLGAPLGIGPGVRPRAALGPDGDTLYLGLQDGDFGPTGDAAKIVAIDITNPEIPTLGNEILVDGVGNGENHAISALRIATIDSRHFLFMMRFHVEVLEVTAPGTLSFVTRFTSDADFDPDPVGEDLRPRWHMDLHVLDTPTGWRGLTATQTSVEPDFSWQNVHNELVAIDLENLATSGTASDLGALPLSTQSTPSGCILDLVQTAPSLDGQTLFVMDECGASRIGNLSAVAIGDFLAHVETAATAPSVATLPIDDDPSLSSATGLALLVREEIAPTAIGPQIATATADGSMLVRNDADRVIDIVPASGHSFADVRSVFFGNSKIAATISPDLIQATSPQWNPTGARVLGLIDGAGDVSRHDGLRIVSSPDFLPSAVVFASGVDNLLYQLNSSDQEVVTESFPSVQLPLPVRVSADGRRLYTGGFRDGKLASYCAVAEPGCTWNQLDDELLLPAGFIEDLALDPARERMYINTIVGINVIDTSNHDLQLVDLDGDPGNGGTALDLYGGLGVLSRGMALHPTGNYLYVTGFAQPFLYTVDLSGPNPDLLDVLTDVSSTNVSGLDGANGRADGLAVAPDGSKLYFTQVSDTAVHVFDVTDGGATLTEQASISIPGAGVDAKHLAVRPDGAVLYVTSRAAGVTDAFRLLPDASCPSPPCHLDRIDTGGNSNGVETAPAGDHVYVSSTRGVVVVGATDGHPKLNKVVAVLGTGAGSFHAAASPGLQAETCNPCDPIEPAQGVEIDFAEITAGGGVSVTSSNLSDVPVNANFQIPGDVPVFYDISTEATFTGTVQICLTYDDSELTAIQEANLRLLHEQADASCDPPGSVCFADVTSVGSPDTAANVLCGDVAGFSQFTVAIDLSNAPINPTTVTASQAEGTWQDASSLWATWSGGATNPAGGTLVGYSVSFTAATAALPDGIVDVPQGVDPHSATATSLGEGQWYFNLRACDSDGFCNTAVHRGPFGLDRSAPVWPLGALSSSHSSMPSADARITVAWQPAIEPFSGVAGYAWNLSTSSTWVCDQVVDGGAEDFSTEGVYGPGSWYFHICAVDALGHWSVVETLGPLVVTTNCSEDTSCVFKDGFESGGTGAWSSTG